MFNAMAWLVKDAKKDDSLFFHCTILRSFSVQVNPPPVVDSGHGGQTPDAGGREGDGMDEGAPSTLHFLGPLLSATVFYRYLSGRL